MENTLKTFDSKELSPSLQAKAIISGLTRRGFLLLTATLSSCAVAEPLLGTVRPSAKPGSSAIKTPSNTGYQTPRIRGTVPTNPDMTMGKDFSSKSGISFSRVLVSGKYIALTFDDGPHPQNTPRLLNMLRARNIKATFYVIGRNVELYPQVVRRTVAEGHEIGNHSQTHRLLSKLSDSQIRSELSRCRDAVNRVAGVQPRTMRPPYGGLNQRQREMVHAEYGYPVIMWSVDPLDWKRPGPSVVSSRILAGASAGGIVLAHDLHAQTVDAMPATLDNLLLRGYQFVTVSQLLAMKNNSPAQQTAVAPAVY